MINVYFQHWTGQIRKMQLMNDGSWVGGDDTNIVATDAKNATPISAVAYAMDGKATVSEIPLSLTFILTDIVAHLLHRYNERHSGENQRQYYEPMVRWSDWRSESCCHGR